MIRDLYPSDIIALLFRKGPHLGNEAVSCIFGDSEKSVCCAYAPFLRQWFVPNERRFSWVYKDGKNIHGLISARERATSASWEIDYLLLLQQEGLDHYLLQEVSRALLETLSIHAGKRRVRKIFFRSRNSDTFLEIAQSSDFKVYLKEYLYQIENIKLKTEKGGNILELLRDSGYIFRPRQLDDEDALYELIFRMQPATVKNVESINLRDWHDTREKGCLMEKEIVLQKGGSIQGWFSVRKGINRGYFRVMAYTPERGNLERIFLLAISILKNKKKIYCIVRDYQDELKKMLEENGFEKKDEFAVAFKEISITEKRRMLASQQA